MKRSRLLIAVIISVSLLNSARCADAQFFQKLFGGGSKEKQSEAPQNQQPARKTGQAQPQRRQSAPQPQTRTPRQQTRETPPATQQPAVKPEPVVPIEEASADERAEFNELIGASWIWSPAHEKDAVPPGDVYFRKTLTLGNVGFAQVHICADNQYELFVNGRLVASARDWRKMDVHDVTKMMKPGRNVVAVKVTNTDEGAAGLVARVLTQEQGSTLEGHGTDETWRTSVKLFRDWNAVNVSDGEWLPAAVLGPLGGTLPWGDEVVIAEEGARFVVDPEFAVERLITDDQSGSLIAMAFNSEGNILASQEGGPLLLIIDRDRDGRYESVGVFSDQINTAQGILALGPSVFAVGNGPQGSALYRLDDADRNGRADNCQLLVPFRGSDGEHGAHAVRLGPDGLLYVMVGNFARVGVQPSPKSPFQTEYEGDLVQPRYEDPRGHAVGVPAPGGTVLRTDTRGSFVEVVAGGLRNSYDFAFNPEGELFTFDADMEWDLGTSWYRPTRVVHVTPGGEYGWRSGWAKWPEYYIDSLPPTIELGGGSPTGVEYYDHVMFPERLHDTLFVGDWARGLIYAVKLKPQGGSYTATSAVFLKGRPLNVTDMAVGPDGALYFATGGRGTDGGIYRVRWKGKVPDQVADLGTGIKQAVRQPQLDADWARARVAAVKQSLGDRWGTELEAVLNDQRAPTRERLQAIELLRFYGPKPSNEMLLKLATDRTPEVRAAAAQLMGMSPDAQFDAPLAQMLDDKEHRVRRAACEAIGHRGQGEPIDKLVSLLADEDRFVAFAARRTLERIPAHAWQPQVLAAPQPRIFLQGATGLLVAQPSPQTAWAVVQRAEQLMEQRQRLRQEEYGDLLRVVQLALVRGPIAADQAATLAQRFVADYPTGDVPSDRELVKLLAYLGPAEAPAKFAAQLASQIPEVEKLHVAAYAPRLHTGWQTSEKLAFLRYYETVRDIEGGYSVSAYVENFARDFFTNLSLPERRQVLAAGEHYPTSALSVLAKLPPDTPADVYAEIRALDQRLATMEGDVYDRLRVGIVATLGATDDPESRAYLHELYRTQPERRAPVAMSLTQNPTGENWDLLVDSLRSIDGVAAGDVLHALAQVDRRPEGAEHYRFAILQGLRMGDDGGELTVRLLEHWSGQPTPVGQDAAIGERLAAWQAWYGRTFPDARPAELPKETTASKWSYEELLSFLESEEGRSGDQAKGAAVFKEAQCLSCHRMHGNGERLGPDLTNLSGRFQLREVLESIVYPSHVVPDQYASREVVADGRTYVGIAVRDGQESVVVLTSKGEKVRLDYASVEEVRASPLSAMPEGLLNALSLEQVADLFAYLMDRPAANVATRGGSAR